ncbi:MAG: hypothetical protein KGI33_05295 [Thaumarchaeota archaeon]|nr:hypothetical protein [Nitrososphaerota archaeon]
MKKRGPVVIVIGAGLVFAAFLVSYSIMERAGSSLGGNGFFPSPESMFDKVSEKVALQPGDTYEFSHTTSTSQVPLMWGLYITDYREGDAASVRITDMLGDRIGTYNESDPIFIKSFVIPKVDTYTFKVRNTGSQSMQAEMLFTEDPAKSKALTDPNSPFNRNIVPLAAAGFMLVFGIIAMIAGAVLAVMDWRKSRNQSSYV